MRDEHIGEAAAESDKVPADRQIRRRDGLWDNPAPQNHHTSDTKPHTQVLRSKSLTSHPGYTKRS